MGILAHLRASRVGRTATLLGILTILCGTGITATHAITANPYFRPISLSEPPLGPSQGDDTAPAADEQVVNAAPDPMQILDAATMGLPVQLHCPPLPEVICNPPVIQVGTVTLSKIFFGMRLLPIAQMYGEDPSNPQMIEKAIASAAFDTMLSAEAKRLGFLASVDEATAYAQQVMAAYKKMQAEGRDVSTMLPPGQTIEQHFTSPDTIAKYQRILGVTKLRNQIVGNVAPPFAALYGQWMREHAADYPILIDGLPPTFSVFDAYPIPPGS